VIMVVALTAAVAGRTAGPHRPLRFRARLLALPLAAVLMGLPPLLPAPGQALALHEEANRLAHAGRYREAVDAFQKAVAADPLNGTVLPYFGDLLADLYIRRIDSSIGSWRIARERAAGLYQRAERLSPWDGYPRAGLGRLRHAEGRYDEAVRAFREAIALDPYSPRYRLWLGRTLAVMGDRQGAAQQLREAVRLYPVEMLVIERHEGHSGWYTQDQTDLAEVHRLLSRVGRMAP